MNSPDLKPRALVTLARAVLPYLFSVVCLFLCLTHANALPFSTFESARTVIGQSDFSARNSSHTQSTTPSAIAVAVSSQGVVAVAESAQAGRVLLFPAIPNRDGAPATVVLGKPNFTSTTNGVTGSLMSGCYGVAFSPDGNKLLVADTSNSRVLIWNSIPTVNGQSADVVIGQGDFTSNNLGLGPTHLWSPVGLLVAPDGRLLVADINGGRVLIYNSIPTVNGTAADVMIGQADYNIPNQTLARERLYFPVDVALAPDGRLLISDQGSHSVRIWNSIPTQNGVAADVVIGQDDFSTSETGTSASRFNVPQGIAVSPTGQLAISDVLNSRVLIYNSIPTQNGASADVVLGQPNFTSKAGSDPFSAKTLQGGYGMAFSTDGRLLVPGSSMRRVMVFGNASPQVTSISPQGISNKVSEKRTFTLTMRDSNGADDIREMWLLINTTLDWNAGATLIYRPSVDSPTSGQLFLRRGDEFLAPITIGSDATSNAVLDNGAVRIAASDVTVTNVGDSITLTLPVTVRDGLVGQNGLFARVQDGGGAVDATSLPGDLGFIRSGTYTVTPQFSGNGTSAPTLSNLTPGLTTTTLNSGGLVPSAQTFGFFVKDENGLGDIDSVWFLANKARDWNHSATFVFYPRTRRLVLRSDDGNSFLGGGVVGTSGIIENSQVRVDLSKVKVLIYADGKSLGLSLPLQAKSGLVGSNGVWLRVQDNGGLVSPDGDDLGFVRKGTWNVKVGTNADTKSSPSSGNS